MVAAEYLADAAKGLKKDNVDKFAKMRVDQLKKFQAEEKAKAAKSESGGMDTGL